MDEINCAKTWRNEIELDYFSAESLEKYLTLAASVCGGIAILATAIVASLVTCYRGIRRELQALNRTLMQAHDVTVVIEEEEEEETPRPGFMSRWGRSFSTSTPVRRAREMMTKKKHPYSGPPPAGAGPLPSGAGIAEELEMTSAGSGAENVKTVPK